MIIKRVGRATFFVTALVGLLGATLVTSAIPASASVPGAPPCYGASCNGLSPYVANRQDQTCVSTAADVTESPLFIVGDAYIVVRWSSWCGANWVTWRTSLGYDPGYNEFYVKNESGQVERNGSNFYTSMVNGVAPDYVEECDIYQGCLGWF